MMHVHKILMLGLETVGEVFITCQSDSDGLQRDTQDHLLLIESKSTHHLADLISSLNKSLSG